MKYYNKALLVIITLLFIQKAQAQKILKEEDRKMIVKLIYGINSEILKVQDFKFKTAIYNSEDYFSKPFSFEEADSYYKLMNKTAKIKIEKDRLYFIVNILNNKLRSSLIEINKSKNKLFYGKDSLVIKNTQGGGNRIENDIYQIIRNYPLIR
ncbi:hypothetical protein [Flavobacterium covae]